MANAWTAPDGIPPLNVFAVWFSSPISIQAVLASLRNFSLLLVVSYHHWLANVVEGADAPELLDTMADSALFISALALDAVWLAIE
jgi:hypothetical protein